MKHLIGHTIVIEDDSYTITKEYVEGAIAFSNGKCYNSNTYHDGTQEFYDWCAGYVNEEDADMKIRGVIDY